MAAPIEIIDDEDDEFDWDAAVQEIDIACQNMGFSSSASILPPQPAEKWKGTSMNHGHSQVSRPPSKNHRQATLDKFVTGASNPNQGSRLVRDRDEVEEAVAEARGGDDGACYVDIDPEAAKTWIYPENVPLRKYQLTITQTALFSNTLVALPTGLGKTLIAAVVMYNYFRWFPEGKIVFAAPSRPLVTQQIEACHNTVGIPQEWTIDLTGQTTPAKRACLWKDKRVFFVTPQVLEKDIQSGACPVRYLVCLVIDEAHRAMGNYSYCVAVRELMIVPVQLRILALTATPGSKQQTIQQVIDNLQISTLEYRNDSDTDVTPYVHERKMELIQVPMGEKADEINNLILDVISSLAARLSTMGVLPGRDVQTLSPCDLLNSREKFRQAPPPSLPQVRYGEVEGVFGVLITLYHIRKLLSSHGIRPASEMLEEKLKQGNFARMMNRNELIHKARLLMQRSLTHGAPSPKLSKMMEVLVEHFRNNDPDKSRVIIFSNFRGSVRDIMDRLSTLGSLVKPTEFIGQSSGKILKGQTQKVQQAVLEKFRKGGYNVIVATSIGEEGLDIMEVDLVICFDANVSSLRMIQRMGRTGRKHDGRVVVLACEGTEMKGYKRKQATSKLVKKHMHNGGVNSFNFHPSPRMVSHIFKPKQIFSKLSIAEFVPRGKRVKNNEAAQTEPVIEKLTDTEAVALAKYFHNNEEVAWKPSLIAFPHFQEFPTRVHGVKHSSRTGMLIDMMQHLRGISPQNDFDDVPEELDSRPIGAAESSENFEDIERQRLSGDLNMVEPDSPGMATSPIGSASCAPWVNEKELNDHPISPCRTHTNLPSPSSTAANENPSLQQLPVIFPLHEPLFGTEIAMVGPHGKVFIPSTPILAFTDFLYSTSRKESNTSMLNWSKMVVDNKAMAPTIGNNNIHLQTAVCANSDQSVNINCKDKEQSEGSGDEERVMQTPPLCKEKYKDGSMCLETPPDALVYNSPAASSAGLNGGDMVEGLDLSPRLTNFITSGFVPESPLPCNSGEPYVAVAEAEKNVAADNMGARKNWESPVEISKCLGVAEQVESSPAANLTNSTCSKDWYMSSGKSNEQPRQFKRLRKIGESGPHKSVKPYSGCSINLSKKFNNPVFKPVNPGGKERTIDVRDLIDVEAEVSVGDHASDDEEVGDDGDSYDDSFIDDRSDPTTVSTQATAASPQAEGGGGIDMMAVYRRSLLSQSPFVRQKEFCALYSSEAVMSASRTTHSPSIENRQENGHGHSLKTPESGFGHSNFSNGKNSVCSRTNLDRNVEDSIPSTSGRSDHIISDTMSKKRKLGSREAAAFVCATNLEKEFSVIGGATSATDGRESSQLCCQVANDNLNGSLLSLDDPFYDGLDFDELEAQAAKLLKQKADSSKQTVANILGSPPSFDLGI